MKPVMRNKLIVVIWQRLSFFMKLCLSFMLCVFRFRSPVISAFTHDTYVAIDGAWITFHWKVQHAWMITITGAGSFINETSCRIPVNGKRNTYTLVAYGIFMNRTHTVQIKPAFIDEKLRFDALLTTPEVPKYIGVSMEPVSFGISCRSIVPEIQLGNSPEIPAFKHPSKE